MNRFRFIACVSAVLCFNGACREWASYHAARSDDIPIALRDIAVRDGRFEATGPNDGRGEGNTPDAELTAKDVARDLATLGGLVELRITNENWMCKLEVSNKKSSTSAIERVRWRWKDPRTVFDYINADGYSTPPLGSNNEGIYASDVTVTFTPPIAAGSSTSSPCDLDDKKDWNLTTVAVYAANSGKLTVYYASSKTLDLIIPMTAQQPKLATDCLWRVAW